MEIRFGALSPQLHEQLGVSESETEWEQKLADAIVLCHVQSILTDAEARKARKRLLKKLTKRFGK